MTKQRFYYLMLAFAGFILVLIGAFLPIRPAFPELLAWGIMGAGFLTIAYAAWRSA